MTRDRLSASRRGFLALAGSATLAGCGAVGSLWEDEPPTIDGGELRDAVSGETPTVTEPVPVDIEQSYLDGTTARARDLLSSVPAPFDAEEIPNGAIRTELERMYENATEALDRASEADSPAESMGRLRRARERARAVETAWAAIDGDRSRADVREAIPPVREEMDAFRGRWRYVGDDPVRAVLAHAQVEEWVAYTGRRLRNAGERPRHRRDNPVEVGEFAGSVESARAALDDAAYVYDRFASSLADSRSVGDGLRSAGESLTETLDERRAALPGDPHDDASALVDGDVEGTPAGFALSRLRDVEYAHGLADERATGRRASVVVSAHDTLIRVRAFEILRERVANGDHVRVTSADDVRAIREAAIEAVEEAAAADDDARLNRRAVHSLADFEYTDDELERYADQDEVEVAWLDRELGRYVVKEAMALATPETSAEVGDVIRSEL